VNGWKEAQTSDKPAPKDKNFKELNRQALQSNVHTAKVNRISYRNRQILEKLEILWLSQDKDKKSYPSCYRANSSSMEFPTDHQLP